MWYRARESRPHIWNKVEPGQQTLSQGERERGSVHGYPVLALLLFLFGSSSFSPSFFPFFLFPPVPRHVCYFAICDLSSDLHIP